MSSGAGTKTKGEQKWHTLLPGWLLSLRLPNAKELQSIVD